MDGLIESSFTIKMALMMLLVRRTGIMMQKVVQQCKIKPIDTFY
jgi:hypothetical protein